MFRCGWVVSSLWLGVADPTCSKNTNHQAATLGQENQLLQVTKVHKHKQRGEASIHHVADVVALGQHVNTWNTHCEGPVNDHCEGNVNTWNAGYGHCDTYTPMQANFMYCSSDFSDGHLAREVCPLCGCCGTQPPAPGSAGPSTPAPGSAGTSTPVPGSAGPSTPAPGSAGPSTPAPGSAGTSTGPGNAGPYSALFNMAFVPADRCFLCPGVFPGQSSVSCSDMHAGNGENDVIGYIILPHWSGQGFLAIKLGAVLTVYSITWNTMSSEVLHLNGVNGYQTLGVVIKGSSIPAGPGSGTWDNTHQPNDEEAVAWMFDNLITDEGEAMAMYQSLGGQVPGYMGLLSWANEKAVASKAKTAL